MILGALTHFSSISYLVKLRKKTWDRSLSAWLLPLQKKKKKVFPFFLAHLTVEAREESRLNNTLESYWVFLLIFRWDFLFHFINTITDYLFSDCNLITENFESKFYQTKNFEFKFYQITCYYNIFKCFFQKCLEFDNLKAGFFFLDERISLSKCHTSDQGRIFTEIALIFQCVSSKGKHANLFTEQFLKFLSLLVRLSKRIVSSQGNS